MITESYAASLMPPPGRRLRADSVRRGEPAARQSAAARRGRPQETAGRNARRHAPNLPDPFERRRAARARRLRRARRLAALLMLTALFLAFLVMPGFAPEREELPAAVQTAVHGSLELMLQEPALPNGCETVSLAMLLDWAGYPIDPVELFGAYVPHEPFQYVGSERYGPDPETAYAGDAASERLGWYCFEGPVVEGANLWLSACGAGCRACAVTGLDEKALAGYLDAGVPLAVWVTRDYEPPNTRDFAWILPDGSEYVPYTNLHCVVLAGRGENGLYRVADPLNGWQEVGPDLFWQSFDAMGRRAVIVE